MKYISTNIKVLREEARLSFDELSEITNISIESLKLFEKGKLVPTKEEVMILCKPLRIHYEDIIERDILSERKDAGRRMIKSADRSNYNWYLGDKKVFWFYLSYFLITILGFVVITLLSKYLGLDLISNFDEEGNLIFITTWLEALITGYIVMSYPCGVCFIVWLLIKLRYRFVWWHLTWLSVVLALVPICGAIVYLPSIGYSFYKSIVIRGKNR